MPALLPTPQPELIYPITEVTSAGKVESQVSSSKQKKNKGVMRKAAVAAFSLAILTGALFGTHSYLRDSGFLPGLSIFQTRTGKANTDINLRSAPSADNEPIGLVTRNSRVRILKTQNNWHQVDVVEQGRFREGQSANTRGWLNGKYIDLD